MNKNWAHVFVALLFAVTAAEAQVVPKLPTFPDGKWKGCYAVYTHPLFDATIKSDGVMWIQPKDAAGKPVGRPFICYRGAASYVGTDKLGRWRYPISFRDPDPPVLWEATQLSKEKAMTIHLRGLLQDNVAFEIQYECSGNQIVASGGCIDPAGLQQHSLFYISSGMTPSHDIKPNVEQAERKKLLKDCVVLFRMKVGNIMKRIEYHYADVMRFPQGSDGAANIEFVEVKGPYGPRIIQMKAFRRDEYMGAWHYGGNCPWQGFIVFTTVPAGKIDFKQKKVTMIIK